MSKIVSTLLLVGVFWAPPVLAILANRANPSLGSGLGVPIGFLIGFVFGAVVTLIVHLLTRGRPAVRPNYLVVTIAALGVVGLYPLANSGALSVVH